MEQINDRDRTPGIAVVAFILGCICLAFLTVLILMILLDRTYQNGQIPTAVSAAFLIVFSLLLCASPTCGVGALITGIIGLKKSKRSSPPSKKGVCLSAIAIAVGVFMSLLILVSLFFGGLFGIQAKNLL